MIKSNLKEMLDSRRISIRQFSERIDYRFESVRQMYHGTTTRIPVELLDRVCRELNCPVSAVIEYKDYNGGLKNDRTGKV